MKVVINIPEIKQHTFKPVAGTVFRCGTSIFMIVNIETNALDGCKPPSLALYAILLQDDYPNSLKTERHAAPTVCLWTDNWQKMEKLNILTTSPVITITRPNL